jgi:cytochrome c-type biogenesis protein CcmH
MRIPRIGVPILLALLVSAPAGALTVSEVAREMSCRCGCSMTVDGCNHTNCPFAVPARKTIGEKIEAGMTKEAILRFYVSQYGEQVLAAPTKTGFNLTAWILPFVMILAGGAIVRTVVKRWTRTERASPSSPADAPSDAGDAGYREKLEKELKDLDR